MNASGALRKPTPVRGGTTPTGTLASRVDWFRQWLRRRPRPGRRRPGPGRLGPRRFSGDRGSAIIELAIVMPVVIVLLLTVAALGRYSHSTILVEQAAAAAARAASLTSSPGDAARAARGAAEATLSGAGLACTTMTASVDTSVFRPGGQVQVRVTCSADLSTLALTGVPGRSVLTSSAAAPLEEFRQFRTPAR